MATDWQIKRLAGALGAEVSGTDLTTTTASDIERIKALLLEHKVLFFPGQTISPSQHVEFGHNFGELEDHPNLKNPFTDHPYIFELAATQGGVADEWHTDITFQDQPSIMSILHMVKCPEVGGDTMWTNLKQAFDELSTPMQQLCEGTTALHDAAPHSRPDIMAIHPVVRLHPETGRKSLYERTLHPSHRRDERYRKRCGAGLPYRLGKEPTLYRAATTGLQGPLQYGTTAAPSTLS